MLGERDFVMLGSLSDLFDSERFLPHGHCFLWEPQILWLHVVSDALIGAAYYSIPLAILLLAWKRRDIPFRIIYILFGVFIVLCGSTHLFSIWVLWNPDYGAEGVVKALTAIASVFTAIVTWKILPQAITLPTPAEFREMQDKEKELQHAVHQSEQQFRTLIDGVTDYAIYMLDTKGTVISWNVGAERIKGYKADEIIGQHFSRFYTTEDQISGEPKQTLATALADGRYEEEVWRIRKNSDRFRAHVVMDPVYDEAGTHIGFAKITRDITEQYNAEEALEKTREQLHQAQKMEMVGHLTGGVAHDFNNLLQTVIGSLALVSKSVTNDKMGLLIDTAQKAAARGAKLTQQLLAFSRQQALRPETADVNQVIESFRALLRQACGYTAHLQFDLDQTLWLTDIDQAQLQSGLLNLVINARDAMPNGGEIVIQTKNIVLDTAKAAELSGITAGPCVMVTVSDTGEGMTPEVQVRAIEPFYTTKDVGKGSGLGLSQVYGFMRQSKGQMEIQSSVGCGTTVRLYLPKSSGMVAAKPPTKPDEMQRLDDPSSPDDQAHDEEPKAGSILVVEDDPLVLAITVEAVRNLGYNVYPAIDAQRARSFLDQGIHIDVLFTDVIMPDGMNGLELAREVLHRRPQTRVLMVSGYSKEILAAKEGISDIALMTKPYQLSDLAHALRDILKRS
jgi:PAS domain S-box-containing protein